jgi:NADP-dependent 3-hydroxy acid dehydrogenase YdfG
MSVAVITGAASGIGASLARHAAACGMHVVLADVNADDITKLAAEIGDRALSVPTDVSVPEDVEALANVAFSKFGHVDFLFNNAGVLSTGNSWEIDREIWQRSIDVNIMGIVNALHAFVPRLLAAGRPSRIVNTASVGGFFRANRSTCC